MWQGEALHPGDALTASPLVFLCFSSACLSAAEEDEEGEEGRREGGGRTEEGGQPQEGGGGKPAARDLGLLSVSALQSRALVSRLL